MDNIIKILLEESKQVPIWQMFFCNPQTAYTDLHWSIVKINEYFE